MVLLRRRWQRDGCETKVRRRRECVLFESLEMRAMLAVSAAEQYFAYALNRARHDPVAYQSERGLSVDLSYVQPRAPLAINSLLMDSAGFKSTEMASSNYFGHTSAVTGKTPNELIRATGYALPSTVRAGGTTWLIGATGNQVESIAGGLSTADAALEALIVDAGINPPGHRIHLLGIDAFNGAAREIGVGYAENAAATYRWYWAIHATLSTDTGPYLTGVTYADGNSNRRFNEGEGLGGVTVTATGTTGTFTTTSISAGGWSLKVPAGQYVVTATGGGFSGTSSASITVGVDNVQVDFISGGPNAWVNFTPFANNAPVLSTSTPPILPPVVIGATNPASVTVADLVGSSVTDIDPLAARGIAITAASSPTVGVWQYSLDGAATWSALGSPTNTSARLLRATDLVRFLPAATATPGMIATISYRAWDQTTGTGGATADTTVNGGNSAFSSAIAAATSVLVGGTPSGTASQVYVNQFGDAVLDGLVLGSPGLQFPGSLTWHDSGLATIRTTGPLNTLLAWDSPQGMVTDSTLGGAVISRPVTAWDGQQVSVAGRDATSFGLTGVTVDGPSYQGVETIAISGGSGSTSGSITSAGGYSFYRFTAPASGRVRVAVAGRETDFHPTMVIFDGRGTPIGGSFLSALGDDLRGSAVRQVDWSGRVDAGQEYFVRVDGAGTDTGTYDLSITSGGSEFRVTTGADNGIGSLRWAIDQANLSADPSTIWFDVSAGSGVALTTSLPAVTFDTAFRFAAGVSGFTIDAGGLSAGAGPVLSVSGYGLTVSRTFASVDFSEAPISIVGFPDVGLALPDDLFNANISGLTLVGRDVTSSIGISIGDSSGGRYPGTRIFGNTISGAHVGIAARNATELRIEGNTVSGCRSSGIILSGRSDLTSIVGNVLTKNGTGLAGFAASGAVVGGGVGQGNRFEDNVQSGVYVAGASSGTGVFGNTFLRNNVGVTLDGAQSCLVGGLPGVQGNTITADGNTALGQYRAGMYGVGDLRGSIALSTTINTPFLGLNLAQATGLTVVNTLVRNHSGLSLVAQGQGVGMTGTVISGLTVERTGSLPSIDTAGVVLIDATGMTLESGNFSGDTTALFVFNDATGLVVADNVFAGRTTGVGLFQARNLAFGQIGRGNTIQNAAGAGIYTGGNLAGTSVVANRINGCPVGIVLDNTTNLTIGGATDAHGNTITGTGNSTGIWARFACTGTSIRKTKFSSQAADTALGAATGINFQP